MPMTDAITHREHRELRDALVRDFYADILTTREYELRAGIVLRRCSICGPYMDGAAI